MVSLVHKRESCNDNLPMKYSYMPCLLIVKAREKNVSEMRSGVGNYSGTNVVALHWKEN